MFLWNSNQKLTAILTFTVLAATIVLSTARRYGIQITALEYLAVGVVTTPLMLLAATGTLWLLIR